MAYSKSSLIQDVRHLLQDTSWETTSTTTDTGSTVVVPDGTKWAVGDVGEWSYSGNVGGEQFLVQSISSNNLTVVRGYNGTTVETHSSGDRVVKNPDYSVIQIVNAINRVIESVYPTAWKVVVSTVVPNSTSTWFDSGLTGSDLTGMIDLVHGEQLYGSSNDKVGLYTPSVPHASSRPVRVVRNVPTSLASSGVALRFPGGFFHPSNSITMRWRARLTATVSSGQYTDIDEGLLSECIVYGACARLVGAKELPNLREDQRVGQAGSGAYIGTAGWFELKHRELLDQYRLDLMTRIPPSPDQDWLPAWW